MFRQQQRHSIDYNEIRNIYNENKDVLKQQIRQSNFKILGDIFPVICQNNDVEILQWLIKTQPKDKFPSLNINAILMMVINNEYKMLLLLYNNLDYLKDDFDMTSACFNARNSGNKEILSWLEKVRTSECSDMINKLNIK